MAQPILSSDAQILDQGIGHALRQGLQTGTITDAFVNSSTTNSGLQALVAAVQPAIATPDAPQYIQMVNRALSLGLADGSMSDANISAATTVALLVANTYSQAGKTGPISEFI